jgi:hypothetical protein
MATSLFGPTPAELIMAQQKEAQQMQMLRNQQMAQQGQQFGVFAPLYQAGLKFGDVGAQAVTQSLFPQQADPRLQQATAVQSVLAKYADEDQSDPAVLTKIGKDLMSVAPDAGIKALTLAGQLTKKTADPKKQAEAIVLRVSQIPEEDRTEEDNRQLAAANQLLNRAKDTTVQSSKILDDGTVVMTLSNNETVVRNARGEAVTGAERETAIKNAQDYSVRQWEARQRAGAGGRLGVEAEMRPIIAGGERGAVVAQDVVRDTVKQSSLVRKNIDNLQKALQLVEKEGATTGVIAEKFPDWKASTIALRNVQNELGLDIVGAVTFGALSEGELRLALDTALPTNLEPPALAKWIKDKIAAQEKLLGYLNDQARFLSRPGRNLGDWLDEVDRKGREQSPESAEAKLRRLEELRRKRDGGQ